MPLCSNCGQPLEEAASQCKFCGQKQTEEKKASVPSGSATPVGQPSTTFDFSSSPPDATPPPVAPTETLPTETLPTETLPTETLPTETLPTETLPTETKTMPLSPLKVILTKLSERPFLIILHRLVKTRKFWISLGSGLAGVLFLFWILGVLLFSSPKSSVNENVLALTVEEKKQFDSIIEDILQEKLDWAREIILQRVPSRFPEELVLEVDKQKTNFRYETKKKDQLHCQMLVAYHFLKDYKEEYIWHPVEVYLEKRGDRWVVMGESWVREDQLEIE